jgi:thymidylate kinase
MPARGTTRPVTLVSFSGIDGAGKSTQINALCQRLHKMGVRVTLIRFWDDVSRLKAIRESAGHKLFKGDKGIGTPEAPITRKDKNVRSWPMTCIRLALYFFDALSARSSVNRALRSNADVIIFDRYCYDELANLDLHNPLLRSYVALLLKIVPTLDKSFLLDAEPLHARMRKPEYPLDFVYENRAAYLQLQQSTGRLTVILPSSVEEVERSIWRHILESLHWPSNAGEGGAHSIDIQYTEAHALEGPPIRPAA